jgi:hypothetical protein
MTTETHDSNRYNEDPWCDDCHGYGHMPWCPQYVEKVAEADSNEQETEQLIARIHAAMAEDCDCPQHQTGAAKIDPAVLQRISTAIRRDQTFASLTTVRAAIADVLDVGCSCANEKHSWELDDTTAEELDVTNGQRVRFMDAVCARILALQREPHGMDAGLREDALDNQEFYELMQAYRHAGIADQDAAVAAFEAVKSFVRESWLPPSAATLRRRKGSNADGK